MRADARSLLDRLGKNDFSYKEFADRFSDLELWPLFEALLKEPRLFQQEVVATTHADMPADLPAAAPVIPATATPTLAGARPAEPTPPAERAPAPSGAETLADLFSRYEAGAGGSTRHGDDVRAMLRRLSELDARGEL